MSNITERLNTNGIIVNFDYPNRVSENGRRLIKLSPNSMSGVKTNIAKLKEEKAKNEKSDSPSMAQPNSQPIPVDQAQAIDNQSTQNTTQSFFNVVPLNFSKAVAQGDYHRGVRLGSNGAKNIETHLLVSENTKNDFVSNPSLATSETPEEANLKHKESTSDIAVAPEEKPVVATDESKEMLNKLHISTENLISVNNQKQANQAIRDKAKATNDEAIRTAEMAAADLEEARKKEELAKKAEKVAKEENKNLTVQVGVMISTISNATRATEVKAAELQQEAHKFDDDTKHQNERMVADKSATAEALQSAEAHNKIADEYSNKNMEIRKQLDEVKARIQAGNIQLQPIDMDKIEAEQGSLAKDDEEDSYTFFRRAA